MTFKKGYDPRRYTFGKEDRLKAIKRNQQSFESRLLELRFEDLSEDAKREKLLREQNRTCDLCGIGESWNGKFLTLQLDHVDGNNSNNTRKNCRMLCPNCHTQTPTYCSKNIGNGSIENEKRREYYKSRKLRLVEGNR